MKKTFTLLLLACLATADSFAQNGFCQAIVPYLASSTPAMLPDTSGWIDLCFGEPLQLNGDVQFPENGMNYSQSVAGSKFFWSLGNGTVMEGQNISYTYPQPGAYYINLFVRDEMGCTSDTDLHLRVRVAGPPEVAIVQYPAFSLPGEPISLKGVVAPPPSYAFSDQLFFGITTPLPDGDGAYVDMPLMVSGYPAGMTLQPGQIESICVNMEHSWMRDMEIKLTCPSGQSVILHDFFGQQGGEVFLGIPDQNDEGLAIPIPGVGFDYCWSQTPDNNQTWLQYANSHPTTNTLPSGSYKPFESLDLLAGCPLNGNWVFTSTDLWAIDNGNLFNWSMSFDTTNFTNPNEESFIALLNSAAWDQDPSILFYSADSIVALPQAGSLYNFKASNEFGCNSEKNVTAACGVETTISGTHCFSENYSITVNGEVYDYNHPSGVETIPLGNGCDSVITVDLTFIQQYESEISYHYCQGDCVPTPDGNLICADADYVFNLVSYEGCDSVVTVHYVFDEFVVQNLIHYCDATAENYTVSFEVIGGDSVLVPNGDLINGTFASQPIPNGSPYSFEVVSSVCPSILVEGIIQCACLSEAGSLSSDTIKVCADEMAIAQYPSNTWLDADDVLCFALVKTQFGTPIAQSSTPGFSFMPGIMEFGTTYYLVAMVGNNNGGGCVDINDPCISISNVTPVVFYENTIVEAIADYQHPICLGDDLHLSASGGTEYAWTGPNNYVGFGSSPVLPNIGLDETGTYQVIAYNDCAAPDTATVSVEINCVALAFTVVLNESDTLICQYDLLDGTNLCPDSSPAVELNIDPNTGCLICTGLSVGTDVVCLLAQDSNGDTFAIQLVIIVEEPSNIDTKLSDAKVDVYPNPAKNTVTIAAKNLELRQLDIYDLTGRHIHTHQLTSDNAIIPVGDWLSGAYMLKITTAKGCVFKRLIIE